ncbi:MAG: hypothetical protein ACFBZ9_04940 [Sphingomonadales bacterium]
MINLLRTSVIILSFLFTTQVYAWDGAPSGTITDIQVTGATNFAFRVTLNSSSTSYCGSGTQWAYVNKSHDNYEVFVSILTSAFMAAKPVTLYVTKDGTNNCALGHISMAH